MQTITVQELHTLIGEGKPVDLLDLRTPAEHASVRVAGTRIEPVDRLDCRAVLASRQCHADEPIYLLCHSDTRAALAAEKFAQAGFHNSVIVEGGTQAWIDAGFPVERGERKVLPLDRQVRTVAGVLALTGALLAHFVNPAWIWLSGFVGFGLIVAGLTDFCPMRRVLAAMPWNQDKSCPAKKSCCGT